MRIKRIRRMKRVPHRMRQAPCRRQKEQVLCSGNRSRVPQPLVAKHSDSVLMHQWDNGSNSDSRRHPAKCTAPQAMKASRESPKQQRNTSVGHCGESTMPRRSPSNTHGAVHIILAPDPQQRRSPHSTSSAARCCPAGCVGKRQVTRSVMESHQ